MIVVPVFMISCHASEKLNMGPLNAHIATTEILKTKAVVLPENRVRAIDSLSKILAYPLQTVCV